MTGGLTQTALDLLQQYGYVAIFVFMFLETSMVFPFLPSEVVVPFAAGLLVTNPVTAGIFSGVAAVGAVVGSLFAYYVFGTGGERAASRYGRYIHVSEDEIDRSQRWFRRWGESSVFWGRLLPFLRSVISIPAGFAHMDVRRFTLYSAAGSFLFNLGVALLIYYGKRRSIYSFVIEQVSLRLSPVRVFVEAHPLLSVLVAGLILLTIGYGWIAWRANR